MCAHLWGEARSQPRVFSSGAVHFAFMSTSQVVNTHAHATTHMCMPPHTCTCHTRISMLPQLVYQLMHTPPHAWACHHTWACYHTHVHATTGGLSTQMLMPPHTCTCHHTHGHATTPMGMLPHPCASYHRWFINTYAHAPTPMDVPPHADNQHTSTCHHIWFIPQCVKSGPHALSTSPVSSIQFPSFV